ncbi:MAG: hypothetical protein A3C85_03440 [Candidatus Doudnabacteria bacterium RIFCSPHIGHO2_02_FULL_48_21]|uniref:Uncharacterized protein n=1 Tax=Candidatus Doudnabacteria bacterium RIFCSPLOWO2_02_FULL_48_13 TaxID=1817845 RepID=A0A1F5QAY8_9BACT|nr:MAG: hypothetical protein A3K05_03680 [Candidatus Doudnabacteria bacterium RIFCSPHIGHO2_01_48_18]OGE77338.1 MAG: hypothetical protein A2668_01270 [Candidatus Doudnabacteria bacterium RIFCSPHIGHO2_01_FULL_48_180]OGE91296.1 MAG: hypothetical protein A3F44_03225 [Candidatus Doudnabacteria bacterium RIFCSPHIGHO2_12_FULL_47_25]OGE93294.1 MAG: hypothetical protein A3C85_03440 [Candidatus Doudnabacteria bacterium RIFCSPHIGHO2_02_FULL_48_21]OGE97800.1 MAG: hypothetical protein A3A83_04370 [Candidatu
MIRESETGHFRPGETKPSLENLQQQYAQKLLERETARINYQRAIEAGVRLHNRLLDDLGSKEIKTEMAKLEKERVAAAERLGGLKAEVNSITDEITALAGADADDKINDTGLFIVEEFKKLLKTDPAKAIELSAGNEYLEKLRLMAEELNQK